MTIEFDEKMTFWEWFLQNLRVDIKDLKENITLIIRLDPSSHWTIYFIGIFTLFLGMILSLNVRNILPFLISSFIGFLIMMYSEFLKWKKWIIDE